MSYAPSIFLSFEEFLNQYSDRPRYELADGELIEWNQQVFTSQLRGRWRQRLVLRASSKSCLGVIKHQYVKPANPCCG